MTTISLTIILSLTSCIACLPTTLIMARFFFAGDFNASVLREMHTNNVKSDILCNFVDQCNLLTPLIDFDVHGESFCFVPKQTKLNYILVNNNIDVHHCEILEDGSISSTSDHLPIVCTMDIQIMQSNLQEPCVNPVLIFSLGTKPAPKRCQNTFQVPTST